MDVDALVSPALGSGHEPHDAHHEIPLPAGSDGRDVPRRVHPLPHGDQLRQHSAFRHPAQQDDRRAAYATTPGAGLDERPALSQVLNLSLSYVSGAHALRVGVQDRYGWLEDNREGGNGDLNQLYRNGVPFAVEITNTPVLNRGEVNSDLGVYIQDTWTRRRLTLSTGLRWDHFNSSLPAQSAPAGRFVPARDFPEVTISPTGTTWCRGWASRMT